MKRVLSLILLIIGTLVFFEGCSSSKQQSNEDISLKEKETFTFDEIKADSSAPLPVDSVAIDNESEDIKKADIPSVKTRKKPMDSQETPAPVVTNRKSTAATDTMAKANIQVKDIVSDKSESQETVDRGRYIVQLGAFQSVDNAKEFIKLNKSKIRQDCNIHFSERVKLYQVQLKPVETRAKAQNIVKELKKKGFNDVFVVLPLD